MVKEKEVIEKMTQVEEGDECHHPDLRDRWFVLLLRVTQASGRLLPIGGFMSRAMIQMICDIMGVIPKEADILTDQEVVLEIEDQSSIIEVSREIQVLFHWGGQAITVDSVVATQDSITEIIKEWEVQREKQKELEQEQRWLRENQQECQQQMIEILEKVSEQVKKVENIRSGSMPALDGEYYTPPVSQVKINRVSKLSAPPNLPIFSGRSLKLKKGTNVAHVEASQVVPLFNDPLERGDVCEEITEDITKESQSEDSPKEKDERMSKILEKLDLTGIESWTEQQQCSVKKLLEEYQHLFALNLKEFGKTSLVQHEIRLSNNTPFKERYRRIPPHEYEEVRRHLQEMFDIGAICRSTSPWA